MKANVLIDSGETVKAGDVLEHAPDGTTRPQQQATLTTTSFARVIDPEPMCIAPNGSYRVRCELLVRRPFLTSQVNA